MRVWNRCYVVALIYSRLSHNPVTLSPSLSIYHSPSLTLSFLLSLLGRICFLVSTQSLFIVSFPIPSFHFVFSHTLSRVCSLIPHTLPSSLFALGSFISFPAFPLGVLRGCGCRHRLHFMDLVALCMHACPYLCLRPRPCCSSTPPFCASHHE